MDALSTLFTTIDFAAATADSIDAKRDGGNCRQLSSIPVIHGLSETPPNQGYVEQTHRKVLQTTEINWMKNNPSNGTMNYLNRCIIAIHCEAREIE